jgi:hypothetical protein
MTVVLYAVTATREPVVGEGLDNQPLRAIRDDDLAAVVSDHDTSPAPTESNLWTFEDVVEKLMTRTAVLPARFGATAEEDEEIGLMLVTRREEFRRTLNRVRGAVEIAIRAPVSPATSGIQSPSPGLATARRTGTDYMLGRLAQRQRSRQLAAEIDTAVAGLVRAKTRRTRSINTLAYLVDVDQVDEFIARLDQLNDPEISWSGPWPPYSFITPAGETQ